MIDPPTVACTCGHLVPAANWRGHLLDHRLAERTEAMGDLDAALAAEPTQGPTFSGACMVCCAPLPASPVRSRKFCSAKCRWVVRRQSVKPLLRTVEERFWAKVDMRGAVECWPWTGKRDGHGYGRATVADKRVGAHRLSWEFANGPIPDGLGVLHRCDNPPCVNPAHLYPGTDLDNAHDRDRHGRTSRGPRHAATFRLRRGSELSGKLTEAQVLDIRAAYVGWFGQQAHLAEKYDVDPSVISKIVHRKRWTHV